MLGKKIRVEPGLYEQMKRVADEKGYASVDEFAQHVLAQAVAETDEAAVESDVEKRLQGLGYL